MTAPAVLWIDAQLSPALAPWIEETFGLSALSVRRLGLHTSTDETIFYAAREAQAVVMTKDADFAELLEALGPPPQVLWVTVGNTSNARMRELLREALPTALRWLSEGEPLVEISSSR